MADRYFVHYDELKELDVVLNILYFLVGRDWLTAANVNKSHSIVSVRIHFECSIQRVKKFTVLRNGTFFSFYSYLNQIWIVCCVWNLMSPLIQKEMGPYTEFVFLIIRMSTSEKFHLAKNTIFLMKSPPLPR